MKSVSIILAVLALAAGLRAARYWYKASKVQIIPMWESAGTIEPVDPQQGDAEWISGLIQTAQKAGGLNKKAALWTAASVILSAASAVAGALSN